MSSDGISDGFLWIVALVAGSGLGTVAGAAKAGGATGPMTGVGWTRLGAGVVGAGMVRRLMGAIDLPGVCG